MSNGKAFVSRLSFVLRSDQSGDMTARRPVKRRLVPGSPFNTPPPPVKPSEQFSVDDRVTHDKHGLGTVIEVKGDTEVTIDFGSSIARRFALPNPKLTKL
ncbi:hypothetical protein [Flindersiella endophytica]